MADTDHLVIALAQLDPTVGDVGGNVAKLLAALTEARRQGADLLVSSELFIAGYPPEDLVLKPAFIDACRTALDQLAQATIDGPALLVGTPWRQDGRVYNAVALLEGGAFRTVRLKHELPNYGVFDEVRVFSPGPLPEPILFRGVKLGVMICEDMWFRAATEALKSAGAELLIVPNGSPYESDKLDEREVLAGRRAAESGLALLYVNQVCGQDELVFDGSSFALDAAGHVQVRAPSFAHAVLSTSWQRDAAGRWSVAPGPNAPLIEPLEAIYQTMVLGLRDYVGKNRFPGVVLGLSGGIDSALAAAVAADALGPDHVHCVMLPSRYTSSDSLEDAAAAASLLGVELREIGIEPAIEAFDQMLATSFAGKSADITEENLQSRARGVALMALSNKFGWMVLSTGNKSEMSVGYATLYGDMCGGYAVLKDVYKTTVFALSRWRNAHKPLGALGPAGPVMPERIITKPPTAELRENQTDQDSLPPYEVLDAILQGLIEGELGIEEIAALGFDQETVRAVWRMLDRAEYKRRQAPPGVKITRRAFGRDRRYPITNGFRL